MKMYKIIIVVLCLIGVYALHRSVKQYKEIQEKIEQEHADKVAQEREKQKEVYNKLVAATKEGFCYLESSVYKHKIFRNNLSAYIKYKIGTQKFTPVLYLKISCCTHATDTYSIILQCNGRYLGIDYINDVYPLSIKTSKGKMYGTLEITAGSELREFLWDMTKSPNSSVEFANYNYPNKSFELSADEKKALEEILISYTYLSGL